MKKSFKIISILLVVSMLFAFASCSPKDDEEPTTTGTTETSEVVSTTGETSEEEKETLTVSLVEDVDYFPYKYKDGEKLNGINIDFMKALAQELNMNVEFIESAASSSQKPAVFINQFNSDSFEMQNAEFSKTYITDAQSVIVKASTDYAIYDDFYSGFDADGYPVGVKNGIKIGVRKNTTGDIFASAPFTEWGFSNENVKSFATTDEIVNALKNDEITAIIIDDALARNIVDSVSGFKILESTFYTTEYQVAVTEENEEKKTKIINAINTLIDNGTVKGIFDKYMEY